jgi:hypothetical protein
VLTRDRGPQSVSVGVSPQQPSTTSGSSPSSFEALPDASAARAVHDRVVHRQELQRGRFPATITLT